jgi:glycosyltransferase involved in cell wall biosynthesis
VSLGSFLTVFKGIKLVKDYIKNEQIDVVMPRSTFPAMMVNRLKLENVKIVFDADGLPIEERVDFSGLSRKSFIYKLLKREETKMLQNSDCVLTRSQKAIEIHLKTIGDESRKKFYVVTNGRKPEDFKPNKEQRSLLRETLNIEKEAILWVYCGSLGPQYGWDEMLSIFGQFHKKNHNSRFLILTGNVEYAKENLKEELQDYCTIKSVPFTDVPNYLSAADIAFAIRKPTYSMQGVAPIKLGEYILMSLPTIASKGIGDSENILNKITGNFLFVHQDSRNIKNAVTFAQNLNTENQKMRKSGIEYFSIEKSAKSYLEALKNI